MRTRKHWNSRRFQLIMKFCKGFSDLKVNLCIFSRKIIYLPPLPIPLFWIYWQDWKKWMNFWEKNMNEFFGKKYEWFFGKKYQKMSNFHFFPKTLKIAFPHPLEGGFFLKNIHPSQHPQRHGLSKRKFSDSQLQMQF